MKNDWVVLGAGETTAFFPILCPFRHCSHSSPISCSQNGRTGATKVKLRLVDISYITSALLTVELHRSNVPLGYLSRLDLLRPSSNIKCLLAGLKKRPKPKSIMKHSRALLEWSPCLKVSFHKVGNGCHQKLQLAGFGLEYFALIQTQKCFTYREELQFQDSYHWFGKCLPVQTMAAFPGQWPQHLISAP